MAESFVNPKDFSIGKRSKKFNNGRDKRKADPNGQRLRKQYWNPLPNAYSIQKHTNNTNGIDIGLTSFEEQIGQKIIKRGIALKNQKLIDKVEKLLTTENVDDTDGSDTNRKANGKVKKNGKEKGKFDAGLTFDEKLEISCHGMQDNMGFVRGHDSGHMNCKRIYLAYYDINHLNCKFEKKANDTRTYNNNCGLSGLNSIDKNTNDLSLNTYIKDKHYSKMQWRASKLNFQQWLRMHLAMPKQILQLSRKLRRDQGGVSLNEFEYLLGKKGIGFQSRCVGPNNDSVMHRCSVKNFGSRSYWTPRQRDDKRDYLEVDLKANYSINAVSTRGRPIKRKNNKETKEWEVVPGWPIEYVKRYSLYVKEDSQGNGQSSKSGKNSKNKDSNEDWTCLGEFNGNKDSETENCHVLQSRHVIARFVRFVPLSRNKDGFYGKKSMRIGIYGKFVKGGKAQKRDASQTAETTEATTVATDASDEKEEESKKDEETQESTTEKMSNLKKRIFSNAELTMTQAHTPSVIISIDLPSKASNNLQSKNGYGIHTYQGVDCGCSQCSRENCRMKREARKKRRQLRQMSKQWGKTLKVNSVQCS